MNQPVAPAYPPPQLLQGNPSPQGYDPNVQGYSPGPQGYNPNVQGYPPPAPVVPFPLPVSTSGNGDAGPSQRPERAVGERWTPKLASKGWSPVSSFFLANYHRLDSGPGTKPLSSTAAMLVVQLIDHKWTRDAPFPTVKRLATRMGLTDRSIRLILNTLNELGLVRREPRYVGGPNEYHLDGLFQRLEGMMTADAGDDAEQAGA